MTTRPDFSYVVGMLTRCLAFPTDELLKEAERVLIYLYNTRTLAITYRSSICGTPVRCNWALTLGLVIHGDSYATVEAGAPLHLWLQLHAARRCDSLGHEEVASHCVVHVRGRDHGGFPCCMRGSLPAWPAVRIGLSASRSD
eukprot:6214364-Pleurochrysis_carterae.AAC.10